MTRAPAGRWRAGMSLSCPIQPAGLEFRVLRRCEVPAALRLGITPASAAETIEQADAGGLGPAPSRWHVVLLGVPAGGGRIERAGNGPLARFGTPPGAALMLGETFRQTAHSRRCGRPVRAAAAGSRRRWTS